MLTTLRIKNLALVDDLTVEFQPGYNAITGETGAGKSILIGALALVLGERADRTLIRAGAESCTVEALFDVAQLRQPLAPFLEAHGLEPCADHQLALKRTFAANGTNRQFINGSPATLQTLGQLGEWLVDIHGPHDHQSLLQPARQLDLLDAFAGLDPLRTRFATLVRRCRTLLDQKATLVQDEAAYARQLDLLRHQTREIETARLRPEEDEELTREHQRARNAARLQELAQTALAQLDDDDTSLLSLTGALGRTLQELRRLDPDAECLASLQEQANSFFRDLLSDLRHYADRIDLDPARLLQLEDRLNLIQGLKRKYGQSIEAVLQFGEQARRQLDLLEGRDAELGRLNAELAAVHTELARTGKELSAQRSQAVPRLTQTASSELAELGFRQARLEILLTSTPATANDPDAGPPPLTGFDTCEFQFAPNPGEPPRPLRAIASSGELARVMLALKTVLAAQDDVPLLVFDEVDANVGGETGHTIGLKMRSLGQHRQVLCITHLAPVAAQANAHGVVTKSVRHGRTIAELRFLDPEARITELARMLGGQSATARQHAEALLRNAAGPTGRRLPAAH